jgi:hypothetical protein
LFIDHSSHIINNNEPYLICIEDDNQQVSPVKQTNILDDQSTNLRTVEKSRLFNDKQLKEKLKRKNRWEETENVQRY